VTDRQLRMVMAALAAAGLGVAGYLTYVHYAGVSPVCAIAHGCATVQSSHWSKLAGIPVAVLGLAGYFALVGSLAIRGEPGRLAGAAIALTGAGFSLYLTYLELFEIHAICIWCVVSAALMMALAVLSVARLLEADAYQQLERRPA
jgi:uncharacterized membrane protein